MIQKIIQIGNSTGIIIPKSLLSELSLKEGSQVVIDRDESNQTLIIAKKNANKRSNPISPRFLSILDRVNKQYGQALKKLAEK